MANTPTTKYAEGKVLLISCCQLRYSRSARSSLLKDLACESKKVTLPKPERKGKEETNNVLREK